MRSEIIITIDDEKGGIKYDLEVPTDVIVDKLIEDIKEVLCSYNEKLMYTQKYTRLYSKRLERDIPYKETLEDAGIWMGDILLLR